MTRVRRRRQRNRFFTAECEPARSTCPIVRFYVAYFSAVGRDPYFGLARQLPNCRYLYF